MRPGRFCRISVLPLTCLLAASAAFAASADAATPRSVVPGGTTHRVVGHGVVGHGVVGHGVAEHGGTVLMPTASSLIASLKAALARETSVHLVITAEDTSPHQIETITQDSSSDSGSQSASSGGAYAHILLTPSYVYFSGDSTGLSEFFSMPADDLAVVGSKWVSVKSDTTQYKSFATSITMAKLRSAIVPTVSSVKVSRATKNGRPIYVLSWSATIGGELTTLSLEMDASGSSLPISEVGRGGTVTQTSTFSRWGEAIHIGAPKSVIPITSLSST